MTRLPNRVAGSCAGRCADEAAGRLVGLCGLVDVDACKDFGRILVELDRAAVVGRRLLTAVERRRREVWTEATDRDDARAAVIALSREPGRRAMDSPMPLSGSLPTSSAVTDSMTDSEFFFFAVALRSEARKPVTTISCAAG